MLKKLGIDREELAAELSAVDVEFANAQLKDVLDVDLEILAAKIGFHPAEGLQDFSVAVRDWRMKGLERLCGQAGVRFWAAFFVLERHWRNCGCPES